MAIPKLVRRAAAGLALAAALLAAALAALYFASRQPPDFYRESLTRFAENEEPSGEELEQQALALHNQLQHDGRFEARFSDDEINAWLASELPEKFPRLLPSAFSEPRISIQENVLRLAVGYRRGNIDTVLSIAVEAYLTDQPNEVAIRIKQVRAGWVPVPLGNLLAEIAQRAERAGISIRWSETHGDPLALIHVPHQRPRGDNGEDARRFTLEELRLIPGELVVIGRTQQAHESDTGPLPSAAGQSAETEIRQR